MLWAFIPRHGASLPASRHVIARLLSSRQYSSSLAMPVSLERSKKDGTMYSRPVKASSFTGQADFYESLFFLQDVLKRAKLVSRATSLPAGMASVWFTHDAMANNLGFALSGSQYRQFKAMLMELAAYWHVSEVRRLLDVFSTKSLLRGDEREQHSAVRAGADKGASGKLTFALPGPNLGHVDHLGRAVSIGRRKTASAKIYLVPGTGECLINGLPAIEYFKRPQEMFVIADPFNRTSTFGKYNAWCLAKGGGLSGQAGAVCHGLAKAIVLLDPKTRGPLASLLLRDPRMVERKKPGQPKARKKFTWVKR